MNRRSSVEGSGAWRPLAVCVGFATLVQPANGSAAEPPAKMRTTSEILEASPAADWRVPDPENVLYLELAKGRVVIELAPMFSPEHVRNIRTLVRQKYFDGLAIVRAQDNFVVQWGDPQTRDMIKRDAWGTGGSGKSIGVSEVSPKRTHVTGAVAAAYAGDPRNADSQIYVVLSPQPQLNRGYTVFGQVIAGMDVVTKLRVPDVIRRATIKAPAK